LSSDKVVCFLQRYKFKTQKTAIVNTIAVLIISSVNC